MKEFDLFERYCNNKSDLVNEIYNVCLIRAVAKIFKRRLVAFKGGFVGRSVRPKKFFKKFGKEVLSIK